MAIFTPDGTLALDIGGVASAGAGLPNAWWITWLLVNRGPDPLELLEAWLPHDQFCAGRSAFDPPTLLPPGEGAVFDDEVYCPGAPGETVENAFLILRTRSSGQDRRVFARLRIEHTADGRIRPVLESLTTTPVGFVPGRAAPAAGP